MNGISESTSRTFAHVPWNFAVLIVLGFAGYLVSSNLAVVRAWQDEDPFFSGYS